VDVRKIRDLATPESSRQDPMSLCSDRPASAKPVHAVALAVTACQAGWWIYSATLDDLVRRLRAAEATGRFNRQLQAFLWPAVLMVDEVGYMPLDRSQHGLPTRLPPLRTRHHDHHQQ
jgi:hypothetical protein